MLPAPAAWLQKKMACACLKVHETHIECTSTPRSKILYIYTFTSTQYILNLELEVNCTQCGVFVARRPSRIQGQFLFLFFWTWAGQVVFFGLVHKGFIGLPEGCKLWALDLILSRDPFLIDFIGGAFKSGMYHWKGKEHWFLYRTWMLFLKII